MQSAGTIQMNHANSYFLTGKTFAAQYFTAVTFGFNDQGMNGWHYDGVRSTLWNEVYEPFGMIALPCANTGGEIFPALERGVIDAAEFVGPYQDRRLGLYKAAKFYYTRDWHEPATTSELLINKAAWQTLHI
jgi:TRAP-type mannitol/chloroaromatic compound transport system substrate-binding protein